MWFFTLPTATGTAWSIGCETVTATCPAVITSRSNKDGSSDKVTVSRFTGGSPFSASTATSVTFDSIGKLTDTNPLTRLDIDTTLLPSSTSRDLQVRINAGGGVSVCDPNTATTDPRHC